MKVYVDTSFLVSLYAPDANSALAADAVAATKNSYVISTLTELEAANAMQLRVFRKEISALQAKSSLRYLENDLKHGVFQLLGLRGEAFEHARDISRRTTADMGTRTADLLHIAVALAEKCDCLYSFDNQQRKLAKKLKLRLNP